MLFSKVLVIKCHKKIFPPEIAKAGHGQELRPKSEYRHPAQAGDGARPELLAELATRLQSLEIRQRAVTANYVTPDNPLRTRLQARHFIIRWPVYFVCNKRRDFFWLNFVKALLTQP